MKSIWKFVIAVTASFLAVDAHTQNWTAVSASNITDLNQNKLTAGQLCFLATDQNDNPVSVSVGGGGQVLKRAFCSAISSGAVTAFTVPNPANTQPAGVYYRVTVKDASTGQELLRYTQVTFAGGTFSFDNYAPVSVGGFAPLTGNTVSGNLNVTGNASITGSLSAGAFNPTVITSGQFTSNTASPAGAGILRLASSDSIAWRNSANNANIPLQKTGAPSGLIPADALDASAFGEVLTKNSNGDLWVGPGTGQYPSMATCYAAASIGQTCHITAGWTETWTANLVMNKNNVRFFFHGNATINQGTFQLQVTDGVGGAGIEAVDNAWTTRPNGSDQVRFLYTGTAAAWAVGTSGGSTAASHLTIDNIWLDISGAGTSAIGLDTYGLTLSKWRDFTISGISNVATTANTQIALRMNTNSAGNGGGGEIENSAFQGAIGVQLNSTTTMTFLNCSITIFGGASGTSGLDFNGATGIQWFGGTTNSVFPTSLNLRNGAAGNYVVMDLESGTNMAVADSTTSLNTVVNTAVGNFHTASNSGQNNLFIHGNTYYGGGNGQNASLVATNTNGFPTFDLYSPTSGTNQKLWELVGFIDGSFQIRGLTDDNGATNAQQGITLRRAAAGASGYQIASVTIGGNASNKVAFFPDTAAFASLPAPANGALLYCSDCTIANPCAGGGTGAIAKRLNGAWVCN